MKVPVPELPPHVTLAWTPTRSAVVVECAACRGATALYTTVFKTNSDALVEAVEWHRACLP